MTDIDSRHGLDRVNELVSSYGWSLHWPQSKAIMEFTTVIQRLLPRHLYYHRIASYLYTNIYIYIESNWIQTQSRCSIDCY
jgi:hypothetical protein